MSLQKRIRKSMMRTAATEKPAKASARRKARKEAELKRKAAQLGPASMRMKALRALTMLAALSPEGSGHSEEAGG